MENLGLKSFFLILAILLQAPPLTNPLSFHMASFEPNPSKADLLLSGDAAVSPSGPGSGSGSGSALQLNRGATNSSGSALYHKAMQLWELNGGSTQIADFTTLFCFNISSTSSAGSVAGDGVVSFLLLPPASASLPKPTHGGSLGESTSSAGQENQMVAVKLDLGPGPRQDRFGIDVSTTKSETYVNVSGGGAEFVNKGVAHVRVDYDSKAKNLSASLGLGAGSYHVSYVVDLSVVLPEKVHVGFTAKTEMSAGYVEIHQVLSWSFSSSLREEEDEEARAVKPGVGTTNIVLVVVIVVLGLVIVVIVVTVVLCLKWIWECLADCTATTDPVADLHGHSEIEKAMQASTDPGAVPVADQHGRSEIEKAMRASILQKFSYTELSEATDGFAGGKKIGEGGFGCVYEGQLTDPDQKVAIKKLNGRLDDLGKREELLKEMIVMSKTLHINLVKLIGWCELEGGELLLVSEFISNGDLAQHLFAPDQGKRKALDWAKRYKIADGVASGLQYLHEGVKPCVVHRDIKASNVMLDDKYDPKLGDFGLARFMDRGKSMVTVSQVAGTFGYMDPKAMGPKYRKSSDVYSFGILALEIATGQNAIELAQSVCDLYQWYTADNAPLERHFAIDPSLGGDYNRVEASRLLKVGFRCCNPNLKSRPSMKKVRNDLTIGVGSSSSSGTAASTSGQAASDLRTAGHH